MGLDQMTSKGLSQPHSAFSSVIKYNQTLEKKPLLSRFVEFYPQAAVGETESIQACKGKAAADTVPGIYFGKKSDSANPASITQ